ncbi:MAG: lysophospholipid acyltransferase family protein [Actinomycetota bacterium]
MGTTFPHRFEAAPELPGSDRVNRYFFGAIRWLVPRLWDVEVTGLEHVPTSGPAILTPNHLSFCDSVFLPSVLPRRAWAIGKGEYMDSWTTKYLFPALGMIPVDRTGGEAAMAALDTAARVLDGGRLFMIYPEGTRSRSGNLHKGRTGPARLALRCDAPIIPVGMTGTLDVQPPDTFMMKTGKKVTVNFGAPMWAASFGDPNDPRTMRRFIDAVMFEIAGLSGQTYVDEYAGAPAPTEAPAEAPTPAPTPAAPTVPERRVEEPAAVGREIAERITPKVPSIVGSSPFGDGDVPLVITRPSRPRPSPVHFPRPHDHATNGDGAAVEPQGANA